MSALVQILLTVLAATLAYWVHLSWQLYLGLAFIAAGAISIRFCDDKRSFCTATLVALSIGSLFVLLGFLMKGFVPDEYYAVLCSFIGAIICLGKAPHAPQWRRTISQVIGMVWWLTAAFVLILTGYNQNKLLLFYGALLLFGFFVVLSKKLFKPGLIAINILNTAIIFIVLLPLADLLFRPPYTLDFSPDPAKRYYSYEAARKDPAAFRLWWNYYIRQWGATGSQIYMPDPDGILPFRLRPNSRGKLFNSLVAINSNGFRSKEIPGQKGDAYRILVIGESTTFGATLYPEDRPWPDLLEELIRDRLQLSRPVEVINGGVAAYTLLHNLARFKTDFLPVKPDLVLSYHGINGFAMIDKAIPHLEKDPPPRYIERPAKSLAALEYYLKLTAYKRRTTPTGKVHPALTGSPLETAYGRAYEELYQITQTNGIRLVLANFSMAVTPESPTDVIEFYRSGFPSIYRQMQANITHSELIRQLAQKHSDLSVVDMHPNLNGCHQKFIDLIHMTQSGRQQAAENAFAGVSNLLQELLPP